LKGLRRIASGPFDISSAVSLEGLEEAVRLGALEALTVSPYAALSHLPDIPLKDAGLAHVSHGRSPEWQDVEAPVPSECDDGALVRLTQNGILIAVAECRMRGGELPRIILKRVFV
jgi:tRNA U55 pseudouridine synthase TruB